MGVYIPLLELIWKLSFDDFGWSAPPQDSCLSNHSLILFFMLAEYQTCSTAANTRLRLWGSKFRDLLHPTIVSQRFSCAVRSEVVAALSVPVPQRCRRNHIVEQVSSGSGWTRRTMINVL